MLIKKIKINVQFRFNKNNIVDCLTANLYTNQKNGHIVYLISIVDILK